MCMELGMHLRFPVARGSVMFSGQPSDISAMLTRERLREISVLLSLVVRPVIRLPFKAVFE